MILKKIKDYKEYTYIFENTSDLCIKLKNKNYKSLKKTKKENQIKITFKSDKDFNKLKLLIILSPIFIASFDSGKDELEFFKKNLTKSNFTFGIYENFFEYFDFSSYLNFYESHKKTEDIMINSNYKVDFKLNFLSDTYILSLVALLEGLILDDKTCNELLKYFDKIRNDIIINGRRSILANGIQAFYLSKYVVVWALDLYQIIEKSNPKLYDFVKEISILNNNLKRPN